MLHTALLVVVLAAPSYAPAAPATPATNAIDARAFTTSHECANAARDMHARDAAAGWEALVACVQRDDFTDLDALVDEPWRGELAQRAEGALLLTRVIARRGGDLDRDLRVCRRAGLRLYSLRAALADPDAVAGRLVVVRGGVGDVRRARTRGAPLARGPHASAMHVRAVELDETRPLRDDDVLAGAEERKQTRRIGAGDASVETGNSVVVRVPLDVVFEPAADYVVLLRFEGERDSIVPGPITASSRGKTAIGTYVAAFEPESTLFAWLAP